MGLLASFTYSGIRCDRHGCTSEITGPTMDGYTGGKYYRAKAIRRGWQLWMGRSLRAYCPGHGPLKQGHGMHRVYD